MPFAATILSVLANLILPLLAAGSSPQVPALPEGSALASPTSTPTILPKPLKCLSKNMVSYCIPNTSKYQACTPTVKQVECPIGSLCRETTNAKGENIAYCKFIG